MIAIIFLVGFSAEVWAQNPVRINWTAVTGAQSGIFMLQVDGPFGTPSAARRVTPKANVVLGRLLRVELF